MAKKSNQDPATVAEVDEALEAMEPQFKHEPGEHRSYAKEKAKLHREWMGSGRCTEAEIANHKAKIADYEHDAKLNVEYNRLYQLRHVLERKEGRELRKGRVSVATAHTVWKPIPGFTTAVELPEVPEGVPADVLTFFAGCVADVNKAAKGFDPETSADVGDLGDLSKPVTVKDVSEIHEARRGGLVIRINNAKRYIDAVQAALARLIAYDAEEVTRAAVAGIEEKAQALTAEIEAGAVKAGLDPDAANRSAANAPKVLELLASVPSPKNAAHLEHEVEELLVERGNGAREALAALLAALG